MCRFAWGFGTFGALEFRACGLKGVEFKVCGCRNLGVGLLILGFRQYRRLSEVVRVALD